MGHFLSATPGFAARIPDFAHQLAQSIENGSNDLGIQFCGSGNGINMSANKHQAIRSALCWEVEIAELARLHNDANICTMPARFISFEKVLSIIDAFLNTDFEISYDIESAYSNVDIVYAKSWGSLSYYGKPDEQEAMNSKYKHFIVDESKMSLTNKAVFSHCLPLRRNVKATDEVMDADYCLAVHEAANRKHVQKSMLTKIL